MSNTILIIGAGSGIGKQICLRLLQDPNSTVIGCGRNLERFSQYREYNNFKELSCDVTDEQSVINVFNTLRSQETTLSGLINCAGSVILKPAHLTTLTEFNATLAINLTSCFLLLKYGVPLIQNSGGSFLFFSTAAITAGVSNHDAIAAAKAGVEGLARSAAATYAAKNIRINAIAPGLVKTPLTERIHGNSSAAQASMNMHALGRLGEPQDIASLACWMISPEAQWMTGQVICFDGGLGLKTKAS